MNRCLADNPFRGRLPDRICNKLHVNFGDFASGGIDFMTDVLHDISTPEANCPARGKTKIFLRSFYYKVVPLYPKLTPQGQLPRACGGVFRIILRFDFLSFTSFHIDQHQLEGIKNCHPPGRIPVQ